jgi:hypothetical protein
MKYLIDTTEIYRVDSEAEADQLLETAKASGVLNKYSCVYKERKQKGEIIDSWYRVTLNKKFTDEKDPTTQITISYTEE